MSLGLIFTRLASVALRSWSALIARALDSFEGRKFALSAASSSVSVYVVTARAETPIDHASPAAPVIDWARQRLDHGPAARELASAAVRCNALIGASIVSGPQRENQYLLSFVPKAWLRGGPNQS
jgi:hypothetical protein